MNGICLFSRFLRTAAAACICAALLTAQSGGITTKDTKSKEALSAALKALGGADKIGGIKSLVIKAKSTSEGFSTLNGITKEISTVYDVEIRILSPDNFVRINRFPAIERMPERTSYFGISQGKLLAWPPAVVVSGNGNMQIQEEDAETRAKRQASQVNSQMDEWSRFLIGTLAKTGPVPLTLASGSTPGVFTMTKADGEAGEIEFDSKTGYPSVIRYKTAGMSNMTVTAGGVSMAPSKSTVDAEMRYRDRFSVNGIMFPRIITAVAPGIRDRELRIEAVQINPNLSLKDFDVPKQ